MNVQVLGDDICYGADSMWGSFGKSVSGFFKSDTGKVVTAAVTSSIGQKLTQTQKAQLANIQEAAGITALPQNWTTPAGPTVVQQPPAPSYTNYYIVGGALLIGLVIMLGTRSRR